MTCVNCKVCRRTIGCDEEMIEKNARYNNGRSDLLCPKCESQIYNSVILKKDLLGFKSSKLGSEYYKKLFYIDPVRNIMILSNDIEVDEHCINQRIIGFDVGICKFVELYASQNLNFNFDSLTNKIISIKARFLDFENDIVKIELLDSSYVEIGKEDVHIMRKVFKYKIGYDIYRNFEEINSLLLDGIATYRFVRFSGCYIGIHQGNYQLKMGKKFVNIIDTEYNSRKYLNKFFEGIALLKITSNYKIEAIKLYGTFKSSDTKACTDNKNEKKLENNYKNRMSIVDESSFSSSIWYEEEIEANESWELATYDHDIDYDYDYDNDCEYDGDEFVNDDGYYEEENPYSVSNDVFNTNKCNDL